MSPRQKWGQNCPHPNSVFTWHGPLLPQDLAQRHQMRQRLFDEARCLWWQSQHLVYQTIIDNSSPPVDALTLVLLRSLHLSFSTLCCFCYSQSIFFLFSIVSSTFLPRNARTPTRHTLTLTISATFRLLDTIHWDVCFSSWMTLFLNHLLKMAEIALKALFPSQWVVTS